MMATTANDVTLSAAQLLPVDSTTSKKKKKKAKKKSGATTMATDSVPQQQLDVTGKISSDAVQTPLFTFSQAVKELNDSQEAGEDSKEVLTRFWRHAYRLGEEDGRFEASREIEQTGYQQGHDAAIAKLIAAGHQVKGECTAGRQARVDTGTLASMQDDTEVADEAFRQGKEAGLDEGKRAGYRDGLDEGRLEAEKGALELFFEGCSAGKKDGIAKEKEAWIRRGHAELGACRAGREDLVDAAIMVGTSTRSFTDTAVATDPGDNSSSENLLFAKSEPFSWADDASSIPVHSVEPVISSPPPPRDISCLSSGAQKPFASLQHRSKRNFIQQRRTTVHRDHHHSSGYLTPALQHFGRRSQHPPVPSRRVSTFAVKTPSLDWKADPRLFRLRDALEDLGWFRA